MSKIPGLYENSIDSLLGQVLKTGFKARLFTEEDPGRTEIEEFIDQQFQSHHGACIQTFHPNLLALYDNANQLCGAVGYRFANESDLFLETYLDRPIESEIAKIAKIPVTRSQIVEVGNLAATNPGACRLLIQYLAIYFYKRAIPWVAFTGTRIIRAAFSKLRLKPFTLTSADPKKITTGNDSWGSYYSNDPFVMAGYIPAGLKHISSLIESNERLLNTPENLTLNISTTGDK